MPINPTVVQKLLAAVKLYLFFLSCNLSTFWRKGERCSEFRRFIQRATEETEHDKELSTKGGGVSASKKPWLIFESLAANVI